jgi:hypothetical protein
MTDKLATIGSNALANVPEHLRKNIGNQAGLEDVGRDDVLIPRLMISQGLSPEITKGDPKFIKGLSVGEFFNSLTGEVYGETLNVVPLFFFKQFIEFTPREQGGGIVAMYQHEADIPAGTSYRLDQCKPGEKPAVTEFKNEMCLILKDSGVEPIVVSFKSTGMKTAKKWNALMRQLNLPAYARAYTLAITTEKNDQGTWYGANVTPSDFVPEALFAAAEKYFGELRKAGVKVDTSGLGEEVKQDTPF